MNNAESLVKTTLAEIEKVLTTKTVVGDAVNVEGVTIIPLISAGFGFGAGAGSGEMKGKEKGGGAGGGTGQRGPRRGCARPGTRVDRIRL